MTKQPSSTSMSSAYSDEVSPDSLMGDFRGRPIIAIVAFTVIVHVVLIGVFSFGYLRNELLGEDTAALSEEERLDNAVREATSSLREIADRHGVKVQDLSERFTAGRTPAKSKPTPKPAEEGTAPGGDDANPSKPTSAIEQQLQEQADGPELPKLPAIEDEDDLF